MSDPVKKNHRISNPKPINDLVRLHLESNNRNHRPQSQQLSTNRTKFSSHQNEDHIQNAKPAPQPLLDCLKPESLLITKPFEKSIIRRRRKYKQFDNNRFGIKTGFFYLLNQTLLYFYKIVVMTIKLILMAFHQEK